MTIESPRPELSPEEALEIARKNVREIISQPSDETVPLLLAQIPLLQNALLINKVHPEAIFGELGSTTSLAAGVANNRGLTEVSQTLATMHRQYEAAHRAFKIPAVEPEPTPSGRQRRSTPVAKPTVTESLPPMTKPKQ